MRKRRMIYLVLGVILFIISGVIGYKYFDSVKSYMSKYSSYITTTSVVENYKTSEDGTKKAIVSKYIVDGQAYFKISSDYYENPPVAGSLMQVKYNPENPSEAVWDNDKMNIGIVVGIVVVALLGALSIIKFFVGSKVDDTSFEQKLEKMKERRIKEEVENYKIVPEKKEEEVPLFKKKKKSKMLAAASDGKLSVYNVDEKNNKIVEDTNANYSSITEENIIKENTNNVQKEEIEQANEVEEINEVKEVEEEREKEKETISEDTILKNKEPEEVDYDIPQDLSGYTKKDDNIELNNQDYEIEKEDEEIDKTEEGKQEEVKSISANNSEFDYNNNQTISSIKLTESKDEINPIKEVEEDEIQEEKVDISDIETKVDLDDLF